MTKQEWEPYQICGGEMTCKADIQLIKQANGRNDFMENEQVTMAKWPIPKEYQYLNEETKEYPPIYTMSMQQLLKSVQGLEWFIYSDFFHTMKRDDYSFIQELSLTLKALTDRFLHLSTYYHSNLVLDVKEYTHDDSVVEEIHPEYDTDDEEEEEAKLQQEREAREAEVAHQKWTMESTKRLKQLFEGENDQEEEATLGEVDNFQLVRVNANFVFDVHTQLHALENALDVIRTMELLPMPEHYSLKKFRNWLFGKAKTMKQENVIRHVENWYLELYSTESYQRVYRRKKFTTENCRPLLLIEELFMDLRENMPKNFKSLFTSPLHIDSKRWKQVNTDAVFRMMAIQSKKGNIFDAIYEKKMDRALVSKQFPIITRNPPLQCWMLILSPEEKYKADSFTRCFYMLRKLMKERNQSSLIPLQIEEDPTVLGKSVNIDQYDSMLF